MPINEQQEREVGFISGVDANGRVAPTSYYTQEYLADGSVAVPAQYSPTGTPIKWGNPTPGQAGGTVTYWFDEASGWSNIEQTVWTGTFAFWSGIPNITFREAPSAADTNIRVIRGGDKQAYANFNSSGHVPVGSSTVVQARSAVRSFRSTRRARASGRSTSTPAPSWATSGAR